MLRPSPRLALAALVALLPLPAAAQTSSAPIRLDALGITVDKGASRPFVWTDKEAAYFYGEAAGPHRTAWQGFNVRGFVFVDDWLWETPAGVRKASDLESATVYPDRAERRYAGGLSETLTLLDGRGADGKPVGSAFVVEPRGRVAAIRPLVADSRDAAYFDTRALGHVLLIARRNHPLRRGENDHPVWLAVAADGARAEAGATTAESGGTDGTLFSPGRLVLDGASPVAFAVADTPAEAFALANRVLRERRALAAARAGRMERLLAEAYVATQDARFDKAFAWARLSLDALVMNQRGRGIFAGLPWFNNYWGRDSFIALPGALLVNGRWEEAAGVLRGFARFQQTDSSSADFGRIPNTVSLSDVSYNTTDGTAWYAVQAQNYLRHTGDAAFRRDVWPVVRRAADGGLRRVDRNGFLRHGDQETWMDASAGPVQEWSPRGDRAVDIQGLGFEQLRATASIARDLGLTDEANRYGSAAERVRLHFLDVFFDPATGGFYDHVNADGTPDRQLRPNGLFALRSFRTADSVSGPLVREIAETLAYPWGVASLAQTDAAFHPYHEAPEFYPKDAAYHNGTIWTWLAGPLVSLMTGAGATDRAYEQTAYLSHLALDRGAVGTMPENSDALPRPGETEPRLTGTVSQAWTLAEYVRNAFEDYAGVRYENARAVILEPHPPRAWGETTVRFRLGDGHVTATIREGQSTGAAAQGGMLGRTTQRAEWIEAVLRPDASVPDSAQVELRGMGGSKRVRLTPGRALTVRVVREEGPGVAVTSAALNGRPTGVSALIPRPDTSVWAGFRWQTPRSLDGIRSLRGPEWPLLTRPDVKARPPEAARTRLALTDPSGDDRGEAGTYTYPTNPQFKPGILDATGLTIREDAERWYFDLALRDLAQPGWNPQYGFQLTFAAILLGAGRGPVDVARDARVRVPGGYRYAIYVGGGVRVEDGAGRVLAEYRPAEGDAADPLGRVTDRRIAFSIPKSVLPALPAGTPVTLLVGGQDDHGGAGIGDFRAVDAAGGEWTGGGKTDPAAPNVYDTARGRME